MLRPAEKMSDVRSKINLKTQIFTPAEAKSDFATNQILLQITFNLI